MENDGKRMQDDKKGSNLPEAVPYLVFEGEMVRAERHIKRLVMVLAITIALLFTSNIAWIIYEGQFDTISYQQDGEGINNVNTGTQGNLLNEPEGKVQATEERQS